MTFTSIWTREPATGAPILIGGHRGASTEAGENSLAAFEQAVAVGADFIEFDWRLTSDGVPVVFHDDTLDRLHIDARAISEISFADLHAIDPAVLTVPDALTAVDGRICVLLDTKVTDVEALGRGLDLITPHLGNHAAVAFGVRSLDAAGLVRQRLPGSPLLGLFRDYGDYPALQRLGGQWARLWEDDASKEAIDALQAMGLRVIIMAGQPTHDGVGEITLERMITILHRRPDAVMLNDIRLGLAARSAADLVNPNSPGG